MQKLYKISSIRTNNFNDPNMMEKFTKLWSDTINNHGSNSILYGIYHEYEGNYKNDYTVTTATDTKISDDIICLPDNNYQIFSTDRENLVSTWQTIWQLEEQGKLQRTYQYDFEKYLLDGTVEIHIGVK